MLAETKAEPAAESAGFHERLVAMNEALVLGSVRQHEFTEAAERTNALLQAEICERKQAEEALRLAKAQLTDRAGQLERLVAERTSDLTASNEQLEAFVYSVAHDLRAPLRIMQGFSSMLVENARVALDESVRDYADRIDKSARFMDALLIDLLAFSRVSQRRLKLTSVSLKKVVESVLSRLQSEIKEKNGQVESAASWPFVQAHETTVAQVLFNLVSNALKFVAPNTPPIVRLRAEESGGFIRFWVEDNGLGIPPNCQGEIFHLFTRLNGEKYQGTGLGLAIVQKGVERMEGKVGVISIPGQGSRFWFDLQPSPLAL